MLSFIRIFFYEGMDCILKKILILICTIVFLAVGFSSDETNSTIVENNIPTQIESNYQEKLNYNVNLNLFYTSLMIELNK